MPSRQRIPRRVGLDVTAGRDLLAARIGERDRRDPIRLATVATVQGRDRLHRDGGGIHVRQPRAIGREHGLIVGVAAALNGRVDGVVEPEFYLQAIQRDGLGTMVRDAAGDLVFLGVLSRIPNFQIEAFSPKTSTGKMNGNK